MSSSTDDVEQASPEEEYDWSEVSRIDDNINGLFQQISQLKDRIGDLEDENERLREDVETAENVAETALGVARAVDDSSGDSKKIDVARLKSRNFLIKEAAANCLSRDGPTGKVERDISASVTTAKVKDMAKPEVDLKWQSIVDAWDTLEEAWECFEVGKNSNGDKALKLVSQPPEAIVRAVEKDLDESGLAKRLVGDLNDIRGSEGGI